MWQPLYCEYSLPILKFKKMNKTEVKGNWNEQKGKLKAKICDTY